MSLNYFAILVASILEFICGAIWYMPLFGKVWGRMHGFELHSKEEQEKMQKDMMPLLVVQFMMTLLMTVVLALFVAGLPSDWNTFGIAGFFWLGFMLPTQVSAVIFGGTEPKWVLKKIAIMAGGSLVNLMVAAATLRYM